MVAQEAAMLPQEQKNGRRPSYQLGNSIRPDRIPQIRPFRRTSTMRSESFIETFTRSKGPPQIAALIVLLAFGYGSIIGVVPAVMTDRCARLNHGYEDERDCSLFLMGEKPQACLDGSADAQNAVAWEHVIANALAFFSYSLLGSLSDEYGRKGSCSLFPLPNNSPSVSDDWALNRVTFATDSGIASTSP